MKTFVALLATLVMVALFTGVLGGPYPSYVYQTYKGMPQSLRTHTQMYAHTLLQ